MASSTLIPVSEYLGHSFRPDCDFVDGELQERNLGEQDHSDLQSQLLELLRTAANKKYIRANTEIRVQVRQNRFRVPDVCVRRRNAPSEQIVRQPPLLCIEVLSPDDTLSRTKERVRDFLEMGVLEVWILDPKTRTATVCVGAAMVEYSLGDLKVPDTPIVLSLHEIFQALDEYD